MKHERQLQELVLGHGLKIQEIPDIQGVGPQKLANAAVRVIVHQERLETTLAKTEEGMELEPGAAQDAVDVGKQRLAFV